MATKSILKTVLIKERKSARALIRALEDAKRAPSKKQAVISKQCMDLSREEIKQMGSASLTAVR